MSSRDHLLPPAMQDSWQDQNCVMEPHGKSFARFQHQLPPPASSDGARLSSLAWNNVPSEAGAAPSMSRSSSSSAVLLPGDGGSCQVTNSSSESSGHSGSVLKEHDYIGMAEISSAAVSAEGEEGGRSGCLHLEETDLRLGLGPLKEAEAPPKMVPRTQDMHSSLEMNKDGRVEAKGVDARSESPWRGRPQAIRNPQENPKPEWSIADSQRERQVSSDLQQRIGGQGPRHAFMDGTPEHGALQYVWQGSVARSTEGTRVSTREFAAPQISIPGQDFEGILPAVLNAHAGTRVMVPPSKNGVKRAYSEAMADPARFNVGESRPGSNGASVAAAVVKNSLQLQESEVKAMQKHHHAAFLSNWATSKPIVPAPWHVGLEPMPSYKPAGMAVPRPDNQDSAADDSPPQKGQVVGWPPIRSYRKNTLAAHPKPAEGEGDAHASAGGQSVSPNFVKVNMDGITIGRKVDLNAHTCYEGLLLALEEMFQPSSSAQGASQSASGRESLATGAKHLRLLNGSEFVLTHEDNEGDWMLVGDVPWGMFVNTVRRLRIMRGSEATGLIPRGPEKRKGLV